jgi:uncharacterized membrane protein
VGLARIVAVFAGVRFCRAFSHSGNSFPRASFFRVTGGVPMLRSARERIYQTLAYEAGGLLIATPIYSALFDKPAGQSLSLVVALAISAMIWSPLHNTLFDIFELRTTGRVASDRPQTWRIVHAISHEISLIIVTVPLIMMIGGHGLVEAVAIDIGLSLLYAAYAYAFHLAYDRLRPVTRNRSFGKEAA